VPLGSDAKAGLGFLALGIGVCVEGSRLGFGSVLAPEPGFFPWLGGLVLTGLSVCLVLQARRTRAVAPSLASEWARPALLLAALALYVPLLEPLGYPLTTTGLCVVALRILNTRRWPVTLGVSAALALATFFLFNRVLGVELPAGTLLFGG
jgi:putative tricarboxylic transport membrane protein